MKEHSIINIEITIDKVSMSMFFLENHFLVLLINMMLEQVGQALLNPLIIHL